jgi:hypothetical protein
MEFDMTFEYESFTISEEVNFGLSEFDIARFEPARNFKGPAFVPFNKPILLGEEGGPGRKLEILSGFSNAEGFPRADQPSPPRIAPSAVESVESPQSDTNTAAGAPSAPPPVDSALTGSPEAQAQASAKEARAAAQQPAVDEITVTATRPTPPPKTGDDPLPSIYGPRATFSTSTGKDKSFIGGLLGAVADNALSAAIHGGSIKNAVINTAVGGVVQGIVDVAVPAIRGNKTQPSTEDNTSSGSTAEKPPTTPGGG